MIVIILVIVALISLAAVNLVKQTIKTEKAQLELMRAMNQAVTEMLDNHLSLVDNLKVVEGVSDHNRRIIISLLETLPRKTLERNNHLKGVLKAMDNHKAGKHSKTGSRKTEAKVTKGKQLMTKQEMLHAKRRGKHPSDNNSLSMGKTVAKTQGEKHRKLKELNGKKEPKK